MFSIDKNELLHILSDFIRCCAKLDSFIWVRSSDYQRQLYLSPSYESIWERSPQEIYRNPESWKDTIFAEDIHRIKQADAERQQGCYTNENRDLLFRIQLPNNDVQHIYDKSFKLYHKNKLVAIAGVGQLITDVQWQNFLQKQHHPNTFIQAEFEKLTTILENEVKSITTEAHSCPLSLDELIVCKPPIICHNKTIRLSRREIQCLYYMIQGKSARETGELIFLSQRTVETYINNIKEKFQCRTKMELLSQIDVEAFLQGLPR